MKLILKYCFLLNLLSLTAFFLFKNFLAIDIKSVSFPDSFLSFIVLITVPFIEELIYRWGLKFSILSFAVLINGIIFNFCILIINFYLNTKSQVWITAIIASFAFIIILFFVMLLIFRKNRLSIENRYIKNYKIIFWGSLSLFALSHYSNFVEFDYLHQLLALLYIFTLGYFFSLIRIRETVLHSFLLHIMFIISNNFLLSLFL